MIHINKTFKRLEPNETYILMDFDRTLTTHESVVSFGVIEDSPLAHPELTQQSKDYYDYYRKIETNPNLDFKTKHASMEEWNHKVMALYNRYSMNEESITRILNHGYNMTLRKDSAEFLGRMSQLGVPVIIISAGVGAVIEHFLEKEKAMHNNIKILANFFNYENGIAFKSPMIHSMDKASVEYEHLLDGRKRGLLFGDQPEDTRVGKNHDVIKVGFHNPHAQSFNSFSEHFDFVLDGESSFNGIGKLLIKSYNKKKL